MHLINQPHITFIYTKKLFKIQKKYKNTKKILSTVKLTVLKIFLVFLI